jgi:cystathionine beta-lyase family protein involved in aluminum resistance
MKAIQYITLILLSFFSTLSFAQRAVVTANNYDISDNLDLQAVASIFGESKDLSDFEFRLNDPNLRINNLDLNRDGYVDYLRVVELVEGRTHLIVIQAV